MTEPVPADTALKEGDKVKIACRICGREFDHIDLEQMLEHLAHRHGGKGGGELFAQVGVLIAPFTTLHMFQAADDSPGLDDPARQLMKHRFGEQSIQTLSTFFEQLTQLIEEKKNSRAKPIIKDTQNMDLRSVPLAGKEKKSK
jgi:hypothetical protein